jgi:hypothetical protein
MEISRFPSKRLLRMPGSTTTRGRHVSCDIDTGRVAFCRTENISTPNLSYAAQYLACALPCERFTSALADNPCITRGKCGSLLLHCDGLPPSAFCRSPGAPVHTWPVASSAALQRYVRSWSTSRHGADIVNVRLQPRHAPLVGRGPRSRSGSLAVFAAMCRARHRSPGALTCAKLGALCCTGAPLGAQSCYYVV